MSTVKNDPTRAAHIEAIRLGLIHLQGGPHRWNKGGYAKYGPDTATTSTAVMLAGVATPDTCAVCMWGAAHFGAFVGNLPDQYLCAAREQIMTEAAERLFPGSPCIPGFNDLPDTTYEMALERYTLIYANILADHGLPADWKLENEPCSE